jgi:hypothetical protein
MKVQPPLSQRRFVRHGGMRCPVCRSSAIENAYPEHLQGAWTQSETTCSDCRARWFIEARVSGYRLIEPSPALTEQRRRRQCQAKRRRIHVLLGVVH